MTFDMSPFYSVNQGCTNQFYFDISFHFLEIIVNNPFYFLPTNVIKLKIANAVLFSFFLVKEFLSHNYSKLLGGNGSSTSSE